MSNSKNKLQWVERLAQSMVDHQLYRLEFETEDVSLTLRSKRTPIAPPATPSSPPESEEEPDVEEADVTLIKSKDVGLFRPGPDLKTGARISKGQKLGTIEAVSVVHDLLSDFDGTLLEIVVQDGDPVEYGQALLVLSESES